MKKKASYITICIVLLAALGVSLLAAVTIGSSSLTIEQVYEIILYKLFGIGDEIGRASCRERVCLQV